MYLEYSLVIIFLLRCRPRDHEDSIAGWPYLAYSLRPRNVASLIVGHWRQSGSWLSSISDHCSALPIANRTSVAIARTTLCCVHGAAQNSVFESIHPAQGAGAKLLVCSGNNNQPSQSKEADKDSAVEMESPPECSKSCAVTRSSTLCDV